MGVTIFTLGIGNAFDINQLNAMATDPDRDHVFTTEFSKLQSAVTEKIKERVCTGTYIVRQVFFVYGAFLLTNGRQKNKI